MNRFQQSILTFFVIIGLSIGSLWAQTNSGYSSTPEERATQRIQRMQEELKLTEAQAVTLKAAMKERITKARAATTKAEKKAANKAFRKTLKETLSEEQLATLKAKKEELKAEREAFEAKLDLSDEQKEQMKEARAEMHEKVKALREEKKKDRQARKALRDEHRDTVKEILTPEQFEIWESEMKERKGKRRGRRK